MRNQYNLEPGMEVVCKDNEHVEHLVNKDSIYVIREIFNFGLVVKIKGIAVPLAAPRFVPVSNLPTGEMELANASNS